MDDLNCSPSQPSHNRIHKVSRCLNLFVCDSKSRFLPLDSWFYDDIMAEVDDLIDLSKLLYLATATADHGMIHMRLKSFIPAL